jgi:flavin-dependent dehydrogenase
MLPGSKVLGIQYEMAGLELDDEETVEVYLGRHWAPGFFAWMMPLGESVGRVGLCVDPKFTSQSPAYYLTGLMAQHPVLSRRTRGARVVRRLAGWIPLPGNPRRSYGQGFLVVGDAAGQVKATSGGGIYFSLLAGRLAGQAATSWIAGQSDALSAYQRAWTKRFGSEIRFTTAMRRIINTLPDAEVSFFLRSVAASSIVRGTIERHGDSQYQSKLLLPVLRSSLRGAPRLVPTALRAVAALLSTIWVDAVGANGAATAR